MHRKAPGKPKALFSLLDAEHWAAVGGLQTTGHVGVCWAPAKRALGSWSLEKISPSVSPLLLL